MWLTLILVIALIIYLLVLWALLYAHGKREVAHGR